MASIDDFLDLAARARAPDRVIRASLQRVRKRAAGPAERRQRAAIGFGVVLAHLVLAVLLREAMRPSAPGETPDDHLLVTFIVPAPKSLPSAPVLREPAPPLPRPSHGAPAPRLSQRVVRQPTPHSDATPHRALQAVEIPPAHGTFAPPVAAKPAIDSPPPGASLYGPDGLVRVPPVAAEPMPRDLLRRRHVGWMLPGAPRPDSPDFHVTPGKSPQDYVNGAGRVVAALIAGVAQRPDGNGLLPPTADRGVRTSGRDSGACEDIAIDLADVDPDHARAHEQAEERWERSCEDR